MSYIAYYSTSMSERESKRGGRSTRHRGWILLSWVSCRYTMQVLLGSSCALHNTHNTQEQNVPFVNTRYRSKYGIMHSCFIQDWHGRRLTSSFQSYWYWYLLVLVESRNQTTQQQTTIENNNVWDDVRNHKPPTKPQQ